MSILSRYNSSRRLMIGVAAGLALGFLSWPAGRIEGENFIFYLPNQRKLIPMETIGGTPYLPLIPVLDLRGPAPDVQEKRKSLKVRLGTDRIQFHLNRAKVEIDKTRITMDAPARRVDGQWMVPASFLTSVFARLAGEPVLYLKGTDRAFAGAVHPISYTVRLKSLPSGARLTVQFTGKVSAATASSNGKWLVFLGGAAIEPLEPVVQFQNPAVKQLRFDDQDGRPKLIITPAVTGLNFYPVMSSNRQELVMNFQVPAGAAHPPSAAAIANPASAAAKPPAPPGKNPPAPAGTAPPLPAVVLDAGHGGPDAGARSRDGILEKNLVAALVQQVSAALEATHKYNVILTRSGDTDPSFEQRTLTANMAQPIAFLTFHAGELGSHSPAIRVYTYEPSSPSVPASDAPRAASIFIPWNQAQQPEEARSQQLAADLGRSFAAIQGVTAPPPDAAPARQLRSVDAPAVAIEIGTLAPEVDAGVLDRPAFQQQVAAAVAVALQQFSGAKP